MQIGRDLTVGDQFDAQLELADSLGRGGDRVAALRPVAVRRGEPDIVVLARPVGHPFRERERETLGLLGFGMDRGDCAGLPLESGLDHQSPL